MFLKKKNQRGKKKERDGKFTPPRGELCFYTKKCFKNTDFNAILNRDLYANSEIKSKSSFDIEAINNTNIAIDLARFEKGYYRVFIELEDGLIAWDNIYFRASQTDLDSINYWK